MPLLNFFAPLDTPLVKCDGRTVRFRHVEDDFDAVKETTEQGHAVAQYNLDRINIVRWYKVFKNDRVNDHHLILAENRPAWEAIE